MKLGLYNQPKNASLYSQLGVDDIDSPAHQQLALEAKLQGKCGKTRDFKEGVVAFLEKRPAVFEGR